MTDEQGVRYGENERPASSSYQTLEGGAEKAGPLLQGRLNVIALVIPASKFLPAHLSGASTVRFRRASAEAVSEVRSDAMDARVASGRELSRLLTARAGGILRRRA